MSLNSGILEETCHFHTTDDHVDLAVEVLSMSLCFCLTDFFRQGGTNINSANSGEVENTPNFELVRSTPSSLLIVKSV